MRWNVSTLLAKYRFKCRTHTSHGVMAASRQQKQGNSELGEEKQICNDKSGTVVAFSRPPPIPPGLGPMFLLSLLQTWSDRDRKED